MHDRRSRGRTKRLLDWRSGGWLLLLTGALVLAVVAWRVVPLLQTSGRAVGDGKHVDSYGFDLSGLTLPRRNLVAAGIPKDGIPVLVDPPLMPGSAVTAFNESRRGKYLVADDRVIGVVIAGSTRAYPLRLLNWHEIVNDTLGGTPIAVTYHPLCDSVVVFRRDVAGERLELGVSGLLYNSNLLMYDRRDDPRLESLWSQLLARAVAGPAAASGAVLDVLPSSLAHWDEWLARHPDTTVLEPAAELLRRYERDPYGNYRLTGRPRFPVDPLPSESGLPWMERLVVAERNGSVTLCAPARGGAGCSALASAGLRVDASRQPPSVLAGPDPRVDVFYSAWFAWHAHHPSHDTAD